MRLQILLLVLLAGLASIAFCEDGAEKDTDLDIASENEDNGEVTDSAPANSDKDPFFFSRRRRSYVRRRRSYVRRRRSYVRRRRSYVRRRRSYVRRRRSYVRRRRSYVRRRRSYVRRRRSYVRRRRRTWRRRRSYVRRRRTRRRRRSYVRRRRSWRRRRSYVRRRSSSCGGSSNFRFDRCGRRCQVVRGRLINCCRMRKDFESMTVSEQRRFVRAYKIVSTRQPYKRQYDKLIKMHQRYFETRIHQQTEFLPWHRWFNLQIENLMRRVDCRVTLAYWDWSVWSHDPWDKKKIWSAAHGFGGNGRSSDGCVTTGPFRVGQWSTATRQCLRRGFNGNPPDAAQVAVTLQQPNFTAFEVMLRVNIHESMHCFINGTMCSSKSAEAPEFFLHHGFIDKIWSDYQKQSVAKKYAYFSRINRRMVGVPYGPRRVLNNNRLPGGVRVCYQAPSALLAKRIRNYLKNLTLKQLESLERLAFSRTPASAKRIFHLSARERRLAKYLENEAMKHVDSRRTSSIFARTLSSLERITGFRVPRRSSGGRTYGDAEE